MSKHLKADGTQAQNGDIPVVTPSNIGKGLKYDASTNKYNVNVGTGSGLEIKPDGTVGIALSQSTGNLLQERGDGLYFGVTAPANLEFLHVDAENGVDQDPDVVKGAGTRSTPLKTLRYAILLAKPNSYRTILLKEEQEHIVDCSSAIIIPSGKLYLDVYGEQWSNRIKNKEKDTWNHGVDHVDEGKAPIIKFTNVKKIFLPTDKAQNKVSIFEGFGLVVGYNTGLYISRMHLKDDLSFTLNLELEDLQDDRAHVTRINHGRFLLKDDGRLYFSNVLFSSTGTPTTNIPLSSIDENRKRKLGLIPESNGLTRFTFITFEQLASGGVSTSKLSGLDDFPNLFVGTPTLGGYAWKGLPYLTLDPNMTVSKNKEWLVKHSQDFLKVTRGGVNFVKAPRVNLNEDLFFA